MGESWLSTEIALTYYKLLLFKNKKELLNREKFLGRKNPLSQPVDCLCITSGFIVGFLCIRKREFIDIFG